MVRPLTLMRNRDRFTYHQSSNIFYTGPQSHYTQRKLGPKVPEWLRKSHGKSKPKGDMDEETSAEGKERNKRKALQSFAKEFGRAVRQQRTRGKTKERTDTRPCTCSEYVHTECVSTCTSTSRSPERGSRERQTITLYQYQYCRPVSRPT